MAVSINRVLDRFYTRLYFTSSSSLSISSLLSWSFDGGKKKRKCFTW